MARRMLAHLVAAAGDAGFTRISLETGSQPVFAPARQLYERAGFGYCGPFAGYAADPHSTFMTRLL
jgi:putative acetyltransferase